ncbi:ABC-three component system middle component 1 [Pseudomonas donghuensis]|uniref:ABC-three component system middle component 1 n=1 Tax=Pseudomonas donghuensis TaxID=1163398 RepID=UPI002E0F8A46|nr:ABC-three component system middle component 1 [Pseudomonas donghuensis]
MKLLIKEFDFEFLTSQFEQVEFRMFCSDDPLSFISCIACICETSAEIVRSWSAIQSVVSVYHQPSGGLAAWNVYLAFVSRDYVPLWDKYEIENNKYAARKIILDGLVEIPNPAQLAVELEKQLLGSDLVLDPRVSEPREALLSLEDYVRGAPLDQKFESREKRAEMINTIIEFLSKNENQKS